MWKVFEWFTAKILSSIKETSGFQDQELPASSRKKKPSKVDHAPESFNPHYAWPVGRRNPSVTDKILSHRINQRPQAGQRLNKQYKTLNKLIERCKKHQELFKFCSHLFMMNLITKFWLKSV